MTGLAQHEVPPSVERRLPLPFARTRFVPPRPRASWVARPRLATLLAGALDEHPVVLVRAPAGFGKTTLAAQLCAQLSQGAQVAWVACEASDSDPARFFALLVASLAPRAQHWDLRPAELIASFAAGSDGRAAALAELIDRLVDLDADPLVWIWDDFHLAADAAVCDWVAGFVERLPEHVRCVLLSRDAPCLPLARWRGRGALAELTEAHLRFDADESHALLARAMGGMVDQALVARADGWAAGLKMLAAGRAAGAGGASGFAAAGGTGRGANDGAGAAAGPGAAAALGASWSSIAGQAAAPGAGLRDLFDYLAEEVFERLPAPLQSFLLAASVLPEWTPAACAALVDEPEATVAARLAEAARRHLPVRLLDAQAPALRPDDLFRDFLAERLQRHDPARRQALLARAALREPDPLRRVQLLIDAEDMAGAADALADSVGAILETASPAAAAELAARLAPRLPPEDAAMAYVRGVLAFRRLAFRDASHALEAAARDSDPRAVARRMSALTMAARTCSYMGRLDEARRLIAQAAALDPPPALAVELDIERAWLAAAVGEHEVAIDALRDALDAAERIASIELCSRIADRIRGTYFGFPGANALFRRFHVLVERLAPGEVSQTMAYAQLLRTWAALAEGDFVVARDLLPRVVEACDRLGRPRALAVDLAVANALLAAVEARTADAIAQLKALLLDSPEAPRDAVRVWDGAFVYLQARVCWISGDDAGLQAAHRRLLTLPREGEWPMIAMLRDLADAYVASRAGDAAAAAAAFERAAEMQRRAPARAASDARVGLACELARLGRARDAWAVAEPMIAQGVAEGSVGAVLFESPAALDAIASLVPADAPRRIEYLAWIERARRLRSVQAPARPQHPAVPAGLTEREAQVLALVAAGASNKRIALRLDISLHTVKRHVANLIAKLGVRSRGEAAARWMESQHR